MFNMSISAHNSRYGPRIGTPMPGAPTEGGGFRSVSKLLFVNELDLYKVSARWFPIMLSVKG